MGRLLLVPTARSPQTSPNAPSRLLRTQSGLNSAATHASDDKYTTARRHTNEKKHPLQSSEYVVSFSKLQIDRFSPLVYFYLRTSNHTEVSNRCWRRTSSSSQFLNLNVSCYFLFWFVAVTLFCFSIGVQLIFLDSSFRSRRPRTRPRGNARFARSCWQANHQMGNIVIDPRYPINLSHQQRLSRHLCRSGEHLQSHVVAGAGRANRLNLKKTESNGLEFFRAFMLVTSSIKHFYVDACDIHGISGDRQVFSCFSVNKIDETGTRKIVPLQTFTTKPRIHLAKAFLSTFTGAFFSIHCFQQIGI